MQVTQQHKLKQGHAASRKVVAIVGAVVSVCMDPLSRQKDVPVAELCNKICVVVVIIADGCLGETAETSELSSGPTLAFHDILTARLQVLNVIRNSQHQGYIGNTSFRVYLLLRQSRQVVKVCSSGSGGSSSSSLKQWNHLALSEAAKLASRQLPPSKKRLYVCSWSCMNQFSEREQAKFLLSKPKKIMKHLYKATALSHRGEPFGI
ncbi:uncharacterized protein V6R79_015746 [Siganus canaliculatus]